MFSREFDEPEKIVIPGKFWKNLSCGSVAQLVEDRVLGLGNRSAKQRNFLVLLCSLL